MPKNIRIVAPSLLFAALVWCSPSQAGDVPTGWSRDDYFSYLMFSDIIPEAIGWGTKARALCFASNLGGATPDVIDASEHLVTALRANFTKMYPGLQFLRKSQCTKSIQGDNLYLVVDTGLGLE